MCSLYLYVSINLDAPVSLLRRKALSKMNLHLGLPRSKERLGCKISEACSFFGCELRVARELLTPSDMYHTIAWPLHVCGLKSCSGSPTTHRHTSNLPCQCCLLVPSRLPLCCGCLWHCLCLCRRCWLLVLHLMLGVDVAVVGEFSTIYMCGLSMIESC